MANFIRARVEAMSLRIKIETAVAPGLLLSPTDSS
jgi:hypothetical protein